MDDDGFSRKKRRCVEGSGGVLSRSRQVVDEQIEEWLMYEDSSGSEAENIPDNYIAEQSDHDSATEAIASEEEEEVVHLPVRVNEESSSDSDEPLSRRSSYYYGKNRYKWAKKPPNRVVRTSQHNIIPPTQKPRLSESEKKDPYDLWGKIMSSEILEEVLKWTNVKIGQTRMRYQRQDRPELHDLDMIELHAFLGLLMYTAVFKSNHENCEYIFATDGTGRDIFRCVMSQKRFQNILMCLRFDNSLDREERKQNDKLAAISKIFNIFVNNCQMLYTIGECATIDEMLIAFRGRSYFVLYMPKKPSKYGLKMMCLCDSKTSYFYNGYIYSGKGSDGQTLSIDENKLLVPSQAVIRLSEPIHNTNRNITFDNWFTSIELVDQLKKRGLTCVGTLKKNKREIPKEFQPSKTRDVGTTLYGFTNQITMLSHVPKKRKAVLLVSSMHHSIETDETTGKPEIIAYYNSTKGGVDDIDKKCSIYTSSRRTRRWPMVIFYRMLDISLVNSHILYQIHEPRNKDRGRFTKTLARRLVLLHAQRRVYNLRIPREIRTSLERILGSDMPPNQQATEITQKTRKVCASCPPKLNRKSNHQCYSCKKHVCLQCAKQVCPDCE